MSPRLAIGSQTNPLIVQLSEYEGRRVLDIRRYYTDKKSRELLPTKKGIALNQSQFSCLRQFFNDAAESIERWLCGDRSTVPDEVTKLMVAREASATRTAHEARPFEVHSHSAGKECFFRTSAAGARYDLHLNEAHPFVKELLKREKGITGEIEIEAAARAQQHVAHLLVSFRRATELFEGSGEVDADRMIQALEFEWSKILANYIELETAP